MNESRQDKIEEILKLCPPTAGLEANVRLLYEAYEDSELEELLARLRDGLALAVEIAEETRASRAAVQDEIAASRGRRQTLLARLRKVSTTSDNVKEDSIAARAAENQTVVAAFNRAREDMKRLDLTDFIENLDTPRMVIHSATGIGKTRLISEILKQVEGLTQPAKILNQRLAPLLFFDDSTAEQLGKKLYSGLYHTFRYRLDPSKPSQLDYFGALWDHPVFVVEIKKMTEHLVRQAVFSDPRRRTMEAATIVFLAHELAHLLSQFNFVSPGLRPETLLHPRSVGSPSEILNALAKLSIAARASQPTVFAYSNSMSRALAEFLAQSAGKDRSLAIDLAGAKASQRIDHAIESSESDKPMILVADYFSENDRTVEAIVKEATALSPQSDVRVLSFASGAVSEDLRDIHYPALVSEEKIDDLWGASARCWVRGDQFVFGATANSRTSRGVPLNELFEEIQSKLRVEAELQKKLAGLG